MYRLMAIGLHELKVAVVVVLYSPNRIAHEGNSHIFACINSQVFFLREKKTLYLSGAHAPGSCFTCVSEYMRRVQKAQLDSLYLCGWLRRCQIIRRRTRRTNELVSGAVADFPPLLVGVAVRLNSLQGRVYSWPLT